ncbi:MAG: 6-pyruvoyl tetrahydropterin synthase [Halobacteriovoraceae bacterium]|nr:6-pyruvoyl tetrahydropterin synthase [Halobacteriovoraceae bacterium]
MNEKHFTSTKRFSGFPCTHRQWKADSHCKYVHGYSREFYFEFESSALTKEGWVVDFGGLKKVKAWLDDMFDHTFLASSDDPHMETFRALDEQGVIQLRVLPNVGMEGTAEYVFHKVNDMIKEQTQGRAWVSLTEVRENEKNSAIYRPRG